MTATLLYQRLGGYDGITTFVDNLLPRLKADQKLGRFWQNRGDDGVKREKQLLIDYLCYKCGGPVYYTGRDMLLTHRGMNIDEEDWDIFCQHAGATMQRLNIPEQEVQEIVAFVGALKSDIVEV
ncbi:group I truncated hemoglobin [Agarilytica rhodophyticola]|uniref:group I truncated hemoglobin n=1 Tax=Agarilytica rhodophyticola TaxID=1737490 RepID=UPI000B346760|nr:group 1 truncated hemoglobin [Agarilytica rhodophyticola]